MSRKKFGYDERKEQKKVNISKEREENGMKKRGRGRFN
jgi:hypothetical protein